MAPTLGQIETTVGFQDPSGNALAFGELTLDLSQPAVSVAGGDIVPMRRSFPLDSTGKIANQPVFLYGNDLINPSGTTYRMRVFNSNGLLVADWGQIRIAGSSPVDLSFILPATTGTSTSITNVPFVVARAAFTGLSGNLGSTVIFAVGATGAGVYRISGYIVETQAATNTSTLPTLSVVYTDRDTFSINALAISTTNAGNGLGLTGPLGSVSFPTIISSANGDNISIETTNYASNGATVMQYAIRVVLEFLGA